MGGRGGGSGGKGGAGIGRGLTFDAGGGKSTMIFKINAGKRAQYEKYKGIINHVSGTSLQPYASVNFLNGKAVGGRTMTTSYARTVVKALKNAGMKMSH